MSSHPDGLVSVPLTERQRRILAPLFVELHETEGGSIIAQIYRDGIVAKVLSSDVSKSIQAATGQVGTSASAAERMSK